MVWLTGSSEKPAMKPDTSPLVSKLTLLVLTLILGCLILLVMRTYQGTRSSTPSAAAESVPPVAMEETNTALQALPAPIAKRNPPSTTVLRPPTNTVGAIPRRTETNSQADNTGNPLADGSTGFGRSSEPRLEVIETPAANGGALLAGSVTLSGTPRPEIQIDLGSTCGPLQPTRVTTRHYVVGPQGQLANVVVYIKSGLLRKYDPVRPTPVLNQIGCMYEPYVLGVVAGQTFQIRNSDPVLHNIHATPKLNREFNLGQPLKGQVSQKSFPLPEMFVRIKCDVHPWMFAYVSVFDHPYFSVTDTNGFFQLPAQIPAGTYVIGASHLKTGGELTQEVTLREGEQRSLQFQFNAP